MFEAPSSIQINFAPGVAFKVAPASVGALLEIAAYLEDPYQRQKDLDDLKIILRSYEEKSACIFGQEVLAAGLKDFGDANALLPGLDIGTIATGDANIVHEFLRRNTLPAAERAELDSEDRDQRETLRFQAGLTAFEEGFEMARQGRRQQ